jgi:hypothetical protein
MDADKIMTEASDLPFSGLVFHRRLSAFICG